MSVAGELLEHLAVPVVELGIALAKRALTPAEAVEQLADLAVRTGVGVLELHDALDRAARARQRVLYEASKDRLIGSDPDRGGSGE